MCIKTVILLPPVVHYRPGTQADRQGPGVPSTCQNMPTSTWKLASLHGQKSTPRWASNGHTTERLSQNQKDELVLAIAEAAQNIVKHAYKDMATTNDRMQIKISFEDNELEIGFFDKGKPVNPENIKHRKLDDVKPGGLGTFFIKQIMDEVVFKESPGWNNHLVLTKKY